MLSGSSVPTHHSCSAFVRAVSDVPAQIRQIVPLLADDAVLWLEYPKKSSKRYRSDLSQMHGWQPLGDLGFEAVRQVSIDGDWSALRFRRTEHIATLRRQDSMAMSDQGKRRVADRRAGDGRLSSIWHGPEDEDGNPHRKAADSHREDFREQQPDQDPNEGLHECHHDQHAARINRGRPWGASGDRCGRMVLWLNDWTGRQR